MPRNEPTRPARMAASPPVGTRGPVCVPFPGSWLSWPSFSSSVMSRRIESANCVARAELRGDSRGDCAPAGIPVSDATQKILSHDLFILCDLPRKEFCGSFFDAPGGSDAALYD